MKLLELKPNTIILTQSKEEVKRLYNIIGKECDQNRAGLGLDYKKFFYDGDWCWHWDGEKIHGSSVSAGGIQQMVVNHPYSFIINCSQLKFNQLSVN
jgi:hypothetical protein